MTAEAVPNNRYTIGDFNMDVLLKIIVFDIMFPYRIGEWPRPLCELPLWNNAKRMRNRYLSSIVRSRRHAPGSRRWLTCRRNALRWRKRIEAKGYWMKVPVGYELDATRK